MVKSKELKKIKKLYGEKFMKLCRNYFQPILDHEGKLLEILSQTFAENSRTLGEDIIKWELEEKFKSYIFSKIEKKKKKIIVSKTPYELLDEAGYILTECTTEEEVQSFKKYYAPREELCTFYGGRLDRCIVFWAVKKNVEDIRRENFKNPKREDEYGTSVMGIQFEKRGMCTVSIKNRYNHTVNNPDATYGNDLDNIVPGLEHSFSELLKSRGLELNVYNKEAFEIPGYVVANDGKYYKYNMEINGIYYCPGNVIIKNGTPITLEHPESQILIDEFVIDLKQKKIYVYDENIPDSFIDYFKDIDIENISVTVNKEKGTRTIIIKEKESKKSIKIEIDKDNKIVGYTNERLTDAGCNFLFHNQTLTDLNLPKLTDAGNGFLYSNKCLTKLHLPNLIKAGDYFLYYNERLAELNLPNLRKVRDHFLYNNEAITKLNLNKLTEVGDSFLFFNQVINELNLPKLKKVGDNFLYYNQFLNELYLPNLIQIGEDFLGSNRSLGKVYMPKLIKNNDVCENIFIKEFLSSRDIVILDKKSKLTTSEISFAGRIIENLKSKAKKLFEFDRRDD